MTYTHVKTHWAVHSKIYAFYVPQFSKKRFKKKDQDQDSKLAKNQYLGHFSINY